MQSGGSTGRFLSRPIRWSAAVALFSTLLLLSASAAGQIVQNLSRPPAGRSEAPRADDGITGKRAASRVAGQRVVDLTGQVHVIGRSPGCRAIVVVFLATECPISNQSLPRLNRIARAFERQGVEVYGVIAEGAATRSEALRHRKEYRIRFPVLLDETGALVEALRPTHTPHAFVLDVQGRTLYSGRIDDRYPGLTKKSIRAGRQYLSDAVQSALHGRPVAVPKTEPIGCLLETGKRREGTGPITYARHIAPIMLAHCVGCHRGGEVAPFPLTSYEDVSKRAGQVALVVSRRIMPPWKPVEGFGAFQGERRLSKREIELIRQWAETGAPRGDPDDLPPMPTFASGWKLGQPDLVLEMPQAFSIPADGPDIYQHFVLPTGLKNNRLVAAVEFQPGNPRVVHHTNYYLDTSGWARRLDALDPRPGYERFGGPGIVVAGFLGGWTPGVTPHRLPAEMGMPMPAGADLVLQIHYHPSGKPERDRSRLGIHFAPASARRLVTDLFVGTVDLEIPAGQDDYRQTASYTLPVDVTLLSVKPHMHLLGREMKVTATLPDFTRRPLIWIKDWDFNWQDQYYYRDPVRLPRGTVITMQMRYDNSAGNRFNPNSPPKTVYFGEQSTDEMATCFFRATTSRLSDYYRLKRHNEAYYQENLRRYLVRQRERAGLFKESRPFGESRALTP